MTEFADEFINQISKVNPSSNVNDENYNLPISELEHNVKFLAKLLSVASASSPNFLSVVYGNLLDYDNTGNKTFFNGGNFDCFEKKNSWLAVDDGQVVNSSDIQSIGASKLLVYSGGVSTVDSDGTEHGRWLEREIFIPPSLRGTELVFLIKGTGVNTLEDGQVPFDYEIPYCNSSEVPNVSAAGTAPCLTIGTSAIPASGVCAPDLSTGCYARYEDVGLEVVGATQVVRKLGPWPNHRFYAEQPEWLPEYRTVGVYFKVGKNTDVVKIRIRRTRADGAIALSQMFVGGLPMPFHNYDIKHLDINELFNYSLGITKWNVTTVNGRHVAQSCETAKLPNILTKEQFLAYSQFNRNIEEFDWDNDNGPRLTELAFATTMAPSSVPKTNIFEFDPNFNRSVYYDMRVDGPNPGMTYIGVSFFTNQNEFSDTISCPTSADEQSVCSNIKISVKVGVVNTEEFGNPDILTFDTYSYLVPVPAYTLKGKMGYFEIYGDFYKKLLNKRGSIAYFIFSRDGDSEDDTFEGNFLLAGLKTGIAVPPDDYDPNVLTVGTTDQIDNDLKYPDLFKGDNLNC